jgi:hypothetical protein
MKKTLLTLLLAGTALLSPAQKSKNKKELDRQAIKSMAGCYDIRFNFAETFAPDTAYKFHPNYRSGGTEYVTVVEDSPNKIVLQHLLVVGDTMIIKHWRQDWLYENTELYTYNQDNTWQYTQKPAKEVAGQWTQKVYQVDDSPRYEGTASWVHADGRHYWEATADAPLPRREFSKRSDYNVMVRRNRQEIVDKGWVHEEDNDKVIRSAEGDKLLAQEKGFNTYYRTDMSNCQVAEDWWQAKGAYWADVRAVWDELFASRQPIHLVQKDEASGQMLFMKLFGLQDELLQAKNYQSAEARQAIRALIQQHLKSDQKLATAK